MCFRLGVRLCFGFMCTHGNSTLGKLEKGETGFTLDCLGERKKKRRNRNGPHTVDSHVTCLEESICECGKVVPHI